MNSIKCCNIANNISFKGVTSTFSKQAEKIVLTEPQNLIKNGALGIEQKITQEGAILGKVNRFISELNNEIRSNTFSKKTVQKLVDKFTPENTTKIEIKDFFELKENLKRQNLNKEVIERYLNSSAITGTDYKTGNSIIFLNFEKLKTANIKEIIDFKIDIAHEFTHAIINASKTKTQVPPLIANQVFHLIDKASRPKLRDLEVFQTDLNKENMLNWIGYESLSDLNKSFNNNYNKALKKITGTKAKDMPPINTKHLFKDLEQYANGEKQAYKTERLYRETFNDANTPTSRELMSSYYDAMEEFFRTKK